MGGLDISAIITMVTDFFTSIPWENVVDSFIGSVNGIDWDSLGKLFDFIDFSDGGLQAMIDGFIATFKALFGAIA